MTARELREQMGNGHPHAPRLIRDPIHNYIFISELEHKIINDRMFLRLQHISQQGLAYLTYPSNRTSRFPHSLGCMHIGGRMISTLLAKNAKDRRRLLSPFRNVLDDYLAELSFSLAQIRQYLTDHIDPFYAQHGFRPNAVHEIVLFQSVPLAVFFMISAISRSAMQWKMFSWPTASAPPTGRPAATDGSVRQSINFRREMRD